MEFDEIVCNWKQTLQLQEGRLGSFLYDGITAPMANIDSITYNGSIIWSFDNSVAVVS